jgi:hypothetical protein
MAKYVCNECGGTSDQPGVCQTEGCSMNGQPLTEVMEEDTAQHDDAGEGSDTAV